MQEYIIKPNDTLYLIAKDFDIPLAQLIRANPQIKNPELIQIGQTIVIPNLPDVPDQLSVIESETQSIIDDVYAQNWESAGRRTDDIRRAVNTVLPMLQQAEVPNNTIFDLNAAIRALELNIAQRKGFSAISQANRITQLLADILDFFNVIIPPDILRLAYFARQIIINADQNDWTEAYQNYRRALSVWGRLRQELTSEYAVDVSAFDQALTAVNDAIGQKDYKAAINAVNKMLQLNEELETDFQQQNA